MGCSQPSRLTPERAPRPEEVGDVGVHYPAIACLQLPPDAPHGHVRRASRPKTKVLVSERRLKDRFQNLDHCLLTHPVHTARAFVLLDALPRPGQIAWVVDLANQRVCLTRLHGLLLPGSPSATHRCPRLWRLGHCRSNHQSAFTYSPARRLASPSPDVTPSP